MEKFKIIFFDTKEFFRDVFDRLNKDYNFDIKYCSVRLDEETCSLVNGHDAICVFVNDRVSRKVIECLAENNIKLIALRCAGYNNVDLEAAKEYGIKVVRVPAYSPHAVAEHTIALILALNRKLIKSYFRVREGNFSLEGLVGFDLYGKTAGVIGTGKIGKSVINILKGFGMRILAYDVYPDYEYAEYKRFQYIDLDTLYRESDIITLHTPLSKETYHMINEDAINKMKDGVMLINTSRGGLIDTKALIKGLKTRKIGYAGLDVYEEEEHYFFEDHSTDVIEDDVLARLLTFPNVIITSHQAFLTKEALENIAKTTLDNIKSFINGEKLENEVI